MYVYVRVYIVIHTYTQNLYGDSTTTLRDSCMNILKRKTATWEIVSH